MRLGIWLISISWVALITGSSWAEEMELLTPTPRLSFIQATVDDSAGGNNNQILEPGETARIAVRIMNMGTATAWNVYGSLESASPGITISDRVATFGTVNPKAIVQSATPHFTVSLAATVPCGSTPSFTLTLVASGYQTEARFSLPLRAIPSRDLAAMEEDAIIYGVDTIDHLSMSSAVGDINGDGYEDLILGAPASNGPANARSLSGEVWIIYGSAAGIAATIDLFSPPPNSSVIYGKDNGDSAGWSVAAGDLNGDGYDEVILGACNSSGPSNTKPIAGEAWVLYGAPAGLPASVDLAVPPADATVIYGPDAQDHLGSSVGTGDLNGDGFNEVFIGAEHAYGPSNGRAECGEVWILYGSSSHLWTSIDLASPPASVAVIYGPDAGDELGGIVAAGDLDGDGNVDLMMGASQADGPVNSKANAGETWVMYGSTSRLPAATDLSSPSANASVIYGVDGDDRFGSGLTVGDLNGDGYDEMIVAAPLADGPDNGRFSAGEAWILYGSTSHLPASTDLVAPPAGATVIYGADAADLIGYGVSTGDLDGDGYDEVILGAYNAFGPGNSRGRAGEVWLISGSTSGLTQSIDLFTPPVNAAVIYGDGNNISFYDTLGGSTAAGDFNLKFPPKY